MCGKMGRKPLKMDVEFQKALIEHKWKGNIRELKNVIERAVILAENEILTVDALPFDFLYDSEAKGMSGFKLTDVEHQHIRKVLAFTKGNKTKTADLLGIGLTTLYRKMEEYGIRK